MRVDGDGVCFSSSSASARYFSAMPPSSSAWAVAALGGGGFLSGGGGGGGAYGPRIFGANVNLLWLAGRGHSLWLIRGV